MAAIHQAAFDVTALSRYTWAIMPTIRAITFDFWSTLYVPRDPAQLRTIREQRPTVLRNTLARAGFPFSIDAVRTAYQPPAALVGPAVTLRDTVDAMCERLDIRPSEEAKGRLVRALDELAGQIRWVHAPGAPAVLRHLRQHNYQLGLVANAHFPSSRVIRQVLGAGGALMYFQAFAFSDEVGVNKPEPAIFRHILYHLDIDREPEAVVHVGDDPEADVAGARAAGLRTVRYAGFRDCVASPEADVDIREFRELPDIIHNWAE
ncbi:MAG: HAD family hydrolase [Anaerolineae bacterium]